MHAPVHPSIQASIDPSTRLSARPPARPPPRACVHSRPSSHPVSIVEDDRARRQARSMSAYTVLFCAVPPAGPFATPSSALELARRGAAKAVGAWESSSCQMVGMQPSRSWPSATSSCDRSGLMAHTVVKPYGNRSQVTRLDRKFQFVDEIFSLKLTVFSFKSFSLRQFQFPAAGGSWGVRWVVSGSVWVVACPPSPRHGLPLALGLLQINRLLCSASAPKAGPPR